MRDKDQKLIFEAYQQLNEFGGGGFSGQGSPEQAQWLGTEPTDQDYDYELIQDLIDSEVEENGYPRANDDEGWDELFNSIYSLSEVDSERGHDGILGELLDNKRKEIETAVREAEVQSAQAGMDMDAAGNTWNPYS